MKNLAERLKQIRLESGLSQAEFAKKIGISQRSWSAYESGETRPKTPTLLALSSMGYDVPITTGASGQSGYAGSASEAIQKLADSDVAQPKLDVSLNTEISDSKSDFFKFKHGKTFPLATEESDENAMVLLPLYSQTAAAGRGQPPVQLGALADYIPIVYEMLGGSNPKDCGIVRVVGDSMTDMGLLDGDLAIFDRTRIDGDGVYVISIGTDVRIKHLEHRPIERKIVISSENAKRYPNPEVISYEQAENLLCIHGKVISWMHRHPY